MTERILVRLALVAGVLTAAAVELSRPKPAPGAARASQCRTWDMAREYAQAAR